MAAQYVIRLNLGGNMVAQLAAAEKSMGRLNRMSMLMNRRGIARGGMGVGMGRMSPFLLGSIGGAISGNPSSLGRLAGEIMSLGDSAMKAHPYLKAAGDVLKGFAILRLAPTLAGGIAYSVAAKIMNGQRMTEAVSNLTQMRMAKIGLGGEYGRAYDKATEIANTYGYNRAQVLGTINTLTGLRSSSGEELSMSNATDLARIVGKVAQMGARPYDMVALNMMQLLSTDKPNMRDIREILHQAPILSKYAIQDMKKAGVVGKTDPREWFKDTSRLIPALERLDRENQPPPIARMRGRLETAKQDFWMHFAQKDNIWELIGNTGVKLYGSLTEVVDNFAASLDETGMKTIMDNFVSDIKMIGTAAVSISNAIMAASEWLLKNFAPEKYAELMTERHKAAAIDQYSGDPIDFYARKLMSERGTPMYQTDFRTGLAYFDGPFGIQYLSAEQKKELDELHKKYKTAITPDVNKMVESKISYPFPEYGVQGSLLDMVWWAFQGKDPLRTMWENKSINNKARKFVGLKDYWVPKAEHDVIYPGVVSVVFPEGRNPALKNNYKVNEDDYSILNRKVYKIDDGSSLSGLKLSASKTDTADEIENLTKGSRALIINFNQPIVDMKQVINGAGDPVGLANGIRSELEDVITRGIRIALHNATSMAGG